MSMLMGCSSWDRRSAAHWMPSGVDRSAVMASTLIPYWASSAWTFPASWSRWRETMTRSCP